MLAGIRAVFFDAVGTLLHPEPPAWAVYARVGRRYGSRLSEEVICTRFRTAFDRTDALDRQNGWRTGEGRELVRWREIVAEVLDDVADPDGCFRELYTHFGLPGAWRLDAQAAAVLAELAHRGYALGLGSNFDRRLRGVVAGMDPLRAIPRLVISSEVGWRKPACEFFAALCQAAAAPADQVLYVGDDPGNDYDGAHTAGLRAVLFDPRGQADPAVNRITHFAELLARQ
jgi:putative hydrolase of the HAD superfamily